MNNKVTTIEKLELEAISGQGAVIRYGHKVFFATSDFTGTYYAEIYEFADYAEAKENGYVESTLIQKTASKACFEDNGHAIEWCLNQ